MRAIHPESLERRDAIQAQMIIIGYHPKRLALRNTQNLLLLAGRSTKTKLSLL